MKRIAVSLAAAIFLFACNTTAKKTETDKKIETDNDKRIQDSLANVKLDLLLQDSTNATTLQWLDSTFLDMGKVKEGTTVDVTFRFRNTGTKPLVIANVTASCGCTIPEKPEEPIAPGAEGIIRAKFDSRSRVGVNTKEVFVTANTQPRSQTLTFRVEVGN